MRTRGYRERITECNNGAGKFASLWRWIRPSPILQALEDYFFKKLAAQDRYLTLDERLELANILFSPNPRAWKYEIELVNDFKRIELGDVADKYYLLLKYLKENNMLQEKYLPIFVKHILEENFNSRWEELVLFFKKLPQDLHDISIQTLSLTTLNLSDIEEVILTLKKQNIAMPEVLPAFKQRPTCIKDTVSALIMLKKARLFSAYHIAALNNRKDPKIIATVMTLLNEVGELDMKEINAINNPDTLLGLLDKLKKANCLQKNYVALIKQKLLQHADANILVEVIIKLTKAQILFSIDTIAVPYLANILNNLPDALLNEVNFKTICDIPAIELDKADKYIESFRYREASFDQQILDNLIKNLTQPCSSKNSYAHSFVATMNSHQQNNNEAIIINRRTYGN